MDFNTFILTDAGRALLTKVMKGECKLTLTSFNIGAGTFTEDEVPALTALKDQRASFSFGTVTDLQDGTGVHVTVTVSNVDAKEDYIWTESAIMANDPDAGTILYAAACTTDGSGEKITAYNGSYPVLVTEDIMTGIDDAANVEITVNLSQYLTQTDADRLYAPIKTTYTKIEVDALLDKKADKATTLAGYGITDALTEEAVLEREAHLHRDISHLAFKLDISDALDTSDFDCISVDTIDTADAVNLIHGTFTSGRVYI